MDLIQGAGFLEIMKMSSSLIEKVMNILQSYTDRIEILQKLFILFRGHNFGILRQLSYTRQGDQMMKRICIKNMFLNLQELQKKNIFISFTFESFIFLSDL